MIEVEIKTLGEVASLAASGHRGLDGATIKVIRGKCESVIRPPTIQTGRVDCPPIKNFCYPEVSVATFSNSIVTRTGAVIVADRFIIAETLEGAPENNNCTKVGENYMFDLGDLSLLDIDVTSFCKFGIFNYSIFITEIMPPALLLSMLPDHCHSQFVMHFPGFMSESARQLRWRALGACGWGQQRALEIAGSGARVRNVTIAKANDRYSNHRANQLTTHVASLLRGTFANSYAGAPKRLYIKRAESVARRVTNFGGLQPLLDEYGFAVVALEDMPIDQQINLFSKADMVLAEHGAGLVNAMFMRPGSTVIEMFPEPLIGRWAFRLISHTFHLTYHFNSFPVPPGWQWNSDGVEIDIESLDRLLSLAC